MDTFIQQLINGLVLGAIYALVALGYTMVYGILGLINFAHGEVVMIGAMVALTVIHALVASGVALPGPAIAVLGLLAAIAVCMLLGYTVERVAYRPLRGQPRLTPLITAIGVSIVLQNVAMIIWGRQYHSFPALLPATPHHFAGATINDLQIFIVLLAGAVMAGLLYLVHRTRLGCAMRATAQNPEVAGLMGVNVNTVISITFVIGSALAAVAGLMISAYYGIAHYFMGFMLGLKAFTAAVLGGIGNLAGAMVGGVLLGVIESLGAGYIGDVSNVCWLSGISESIRSQCAANDGRLNLLGSHYQDVFAFLVLVLVLTLRPSGLLGERVAERS